MEWTIFLTDERSYAQSIYCGVQKGELFYHNNSKAYCLMPASFVEKIVVEADKFGFISEDTHVEDIVLELSEKYINRFRTYWTDGNRKFGCAHMNHMQLAVIIVNSIYKQSLGVLDSELFLANNGWTVKEREN